MIVDSLLLGLSPYYTSHDTGHVNSGPAALSVSDAIEDTLDLSAGARDLLSLLGELSPEARQQYLESLAHLLEAGIVGVETVRVDARPYRSFAGSRTADPALAHARPYRR